MRLGSLLRDLATETDVDIIAHVIEKKKKSLLIGVPGKIAGVAIVTATLGITQVVDGVHILDHGPDPAPQSVRSAERG